MIAESMNSEALRQCLLNLLYHVRTEPADVDDEILRIVGLAASRGWSVVCPEQGGVVSGTTRIFVEYLSLELRLQTDFDRKTILASIE